jgi:L-ectoine synthase
LIVKHIDDVKGTASEVSAPNWISRRLLLSKDGMGFSFHETVIYPGTETKMQYLNHLEAVYCVEGEGSIEDCATGEVHPIRPGTIYALDQNDQHILRAVTQLRMACVFNPPCTGQEIHDEHGAYPAAA